MQLLQHYGFEVESPSAQVPICSLDLPPTENIWSITKWKIHQKISLDGWEAKILTGKNETRFLQLCNNWSPQLLQYATQWETWVIPTFLIVAVIKFKFIVLSLKLNFFCQLCIADKIWLWYKILKWSHSLFIMVAGTHTKVFGFWECLHFL